MLDRQFNIYYEADVFGYLLPTVQDFETARDAQVAQLVEQRTENPRVGGSNPPLGTTQTPGKLGFPGVCY